MNKLLGFYELKDSDLPTIPWEKFDDSVQFDSRKLWTIRSAVYRGNDLNLPRAVGVCAEEADKFANNLYKRLEDRGIVIYYPYFCAEKSGTLNVFYNRIIIESVAADLWNLVTYSEREVTIIIDDKEKQYIGNKSFITDEEMNELLIYAQKARQMFSDDILEGKSILLEWSFAYDSDLYKQRLGDKYLVFYEARTIS